MWVTQSKPGGSWVENRPQHGPDFLSTKPFHQKPLVTLRNWDPDVPVYKYFSMFILDKETAL